MRIPSSPKPALIHMCSCGQASRGKARGGGGEVRGYNAAQFGARASALRAVPGHARGDPDPPAKAMLERAHGGLDDNQAKPDVPDRGRYYRNATAGCFPFSTSLTILNPRRMLDSVTPPA